MPPTLREALERKEILVVTGSGGVGKTSVSAAIALAAASEQTAVVVTIDPAKRLASALGLQTGLGHSESKVPLDGAGELHAAMLDMKTAWDELVDRYAPSPEVAERIRSNRLYQGLSEHFIGSQGYMAMERLADLHEQRSYDLIVIDTPPTRSALDFLEAPKRMTDFIGGSLLRWFAKPYTAAGRLGMKAFNLTASPVLKVADRVLGSQVLEDLSEFVLDFQNLYDGFKRRADEVLRLLADERTGFVVVTTLEGPALGEAGFFIDRLVDEGMPLSGVIANRVIPQRFTAEEVDQSLGALDGADTAAVAGAAGTDEQQTAETLAEARQALQALHALATRDHRRLGELERRASRPVAAVPLLARDVADLDSLRELGGHILRDGAEA